MPHTWLACRIIYASRRRSSGWPLGLCATQRTGRMLAAGSIPHPRRECEKSRAEPLKGRPPIRSPFSKSWAEPSLSWAPASLPPLPPPSLPRALSPFSSRPYHGRLAAPASSGVCMLLVRTRRRGVNQTDPYGHINQSLITREASVAVSIRRSALG